MHSSARRMLSLVVVGVLMAAAFLLRSEMVSETVVISPIRADAKDYFLYAYNLTHHGVYSRDERGITDEHRTIRPDAVRSPGYPLFLSLFMGSESVGVFLAKVVCSQVVISTLTVGLAFLLYRRFMNLFWSSLAAVCTTFSPHLIVVNTYLLTESLFCFFLVLTGCWVGRTASRPSWRTIGVLGGLLGAAYLIRPSLQVFPLVLALFMGALLPGRARVKYLVCLLAGFLLVAAPWFGRNLTSLGQFSDNTLQVAFLHHGIYPDFMYNQKEESYGFPYRFDPRSSEIGRSTGTALREVAERFAREPVEHAVWFLLKKPIFFWSWNIVQGQGDVFIYPVNRTPYTDDPAFVWSHRVMRWVHYPLVWVGMVGCVLAWIPAASRNLKPDARATARFISLLVLFFSGIHIIGVPFPRYSVPLRPMIYGMAMFAGEFIWNHARSFQLPRRQSIDEEDAGDGSERRSC